MNDKSVAKRLNYQSAGDVGCPMVSERQNDFRWSAKWISPSGEKKQNYYFLARKEFHVSKKKR